VNLDGFALPVKKLKGTDPVETLDLSGKYLGVASAVVIASLISVNGVLTALNLSSNSLKDEGVNAVCEAIQSNKETKLASLNFSYNGIGPVGANAVAAMVAVTGSLTECNVRGNNLDSESAKKLAMIGTKKGIMLFGIKRDQKEANFAGQHLGPADAILISSDLVTGALAVTNLMRNELDGESAKMLSEVAKQKGISLCGIQRDQTTADFSRQGLKPPDAILLASDLSQAVVTGGLTTIDLSDNQLCGIWTDYDDKNYTAEGITAIADALRVNGGLTSFNLSGNNLTHYGRDMAGITELATALGLNVRLTALDLSLNYLKDEGVSAVCEAIQSNKETKLALLNFEHNGIGPVGANAVAAMVAVRRRADQFIVAYAVPAPPVYRNGR
jgi:NLR family CARD domain-containing protein 3